MKEVVIQLHKSEKGEGESHNYLLCVKSLKESFSFCYKRLHVREYC
jgi:hypothetical protein